LSVLPLLLALDAFPDRRSGSGSGSGSNSDAVGD
jgi:hypothetical protein